MKHLFIVNPVAGGRDASEEISARVHALFQGRHTDTSELEIYVTQCPKDATARIRREALSCDDLRVYACGGDGTFNECVCGAAQLENVAVCPLPTGTGNDFCRMFGRDAERFRDPEALMDGEIRRIDLIACNDSYSANICSVGIDARIGVDVHSYSQLPLIGGAGAYVVSSVVNAVRGISTNMHIRSGDFTADGKHTMVCVCNGRFYGGGFNPSLTAAIDDGLLDIFVVKKVSLLEFAALIGKYAKGQAEQMTKYVTHLRGTEISIDFDREDVINLDGEGIRASSVRMQLLPKALRLIVPKGLKSDVFSA